MMKKKWLFLFTTMLLSIFMVAGCGANDDPSPPVDENQEEAPLENAPLNDAEENRDDIENNLEDTEEDLEAPLEDPDNDGNDELDPNPED